MRLAVVFPKYTSYHSALGCDPKPQLQSQVGTVSTLICV